MCVFLVLNLLANGSTCAGYNTGDFKTVNGIYGARFPENPPARATFAVKTLPLNALVEIDCTAYMP
jgi:enamine deaminase RidA (YjgF/YER057c/UK114 family)